RESDCTSYKRDASSATAQRDFCDVGAIDSPSARALDLVGAADQGDAVPACAQRPNLLPNARIEGEVRDDCGADVIAPPAHAVVLEFFAGGAGARSLKGARTNPKRNG